MLSLSLSIAVTEEFMLVFIHAFIRLRLWNHQLGFARRLSAWEVSITRRFRDTCHFQQGSHPQPVTICRKAFSTGSKHMNHVHKKCPYIAIHHCELSSTLACRASPCIWQSMTWPLVGTNTFEFQDCGISHALVLSIPTTEESGWVLLLYDGVPPPPPPRKNVRYKPTKIEAYVGSYVTQGKIQVQYICHW